MKAMPAPLKPYDQVRVAAIRDDRFATLPIHYQRHPEVGDVAAIVHTHEANDAYEVECSNPSNGETLWLAVMYIDELRPIRNDAARPLAGLRECLLPSPQRHEDSAGRIFDYPRTDPKMIDNAVRGRFNAWLFDSLEGYMHRKYGTVKPRLLAGAPSVVVELGPGAGANLRYLSPGTQLIAIEPNRRFHEVLRRRAAERNIELDLRGLAGEALDLPDASVDFVFTSLVLCSVSQPDAVMREVLRVLKPGGRFACVEHVAAPAGSVLAGVQRGVAGPWKWLFEGCDLCRDTAGTLRRAGFSQVHIEPLTLQTAFVPIRSQVTAICVK